MKTIIVYYSWTGNNALLAESAAAGLNADAFRLVESEPRTMKTIILDMLFQRKPKLQALPEHIEDYDLVIFMGPIWMFHVPAPLRSCFCHLKSRIRKYAYVSLSGGALGPNPNISRELVKRLGKKLVMNLDLNAAHLCTIRKNPTVDDTSGYKIENFPEDLERLTRIVVNAFSFVNV